MLLHRKLKWHLIKTQYWELSWLMSQWPKVKARGNVATIWLIRVLWSHLYYKRCNIFSTRAMVNEKMLLCQCMKISWSSYIHDFFCWALYYIEMQNGIFIEWWFYAYVIVFFTICYSNINLISTAIMPDSSWLNFLALASHHLKENTFLSQDVIISFRVDWCMVVMETIS